MRCFNLTYKHYVLSMLVCVGVMSMFERFVFSLAMESIKKDLILTDSQLGILTGIAFFAFYAIAGIPIARWADRGNRVTISALALGGAGVMVALCGSVVNFTHLLFARAGVAIGEAGCVPTGLSLLSDYFDRRERPHAIAIFTMSYSISMILGYMCGGWLVDNLGWRYTFLVVGIPSLLLACFVKLTLKEPRLLWKTITPKKQPFLIDVLKILWKRNAFRNIFLAFCVAYFFLIGTSHWLAAFFIRSHEVTTTELGAWLAITFGGFGILGNYIGGYWASRFAASRERIQMRAAALLILIVGLLNAGVYLAPSKNLAFGFLAISGLAGALSNGPIFAAIQSLAEERMRSVAMALVFLFANLIGLGLGPFVLGYLSDLLNPAFGKESLRYALVAFCPGVIWVSIYYWRAGETIEADINNVLCTEQVTDRSPKIVYCEVKGS